MEMLGQVFPPHPKFTEHNLPDLSGKVYIVTGAGSGVGYDLAKILYGKNGTVYIATRNIDKINKAINSIQKEVPNSKGRLEKLIIDLADLASVRPAVEKFLSQETRLDVVVHNAGVMTPPPGSKTKLGHDLEMGTNALGPFLFNRFLEPILRSTARSMGPGEVRVIWVTSFLSAGPTQKGIIFDSATGHPKVLGDSLKNYMQSKVGNVFFAHELAKRLGNEGIISMSVCPGLMKTELQRHMNPINGAIMGIFFKPAKYGAYSELFGGLSPNVKLEHNGGFIIPWGRHGHIPGPIAEGMKSEVEGGSGLSQRFWDWCEQETKAYQ